MHSKCIAKLIVWNESYACIKQLVWYNRAEAEHYSREANGVEDPASSLGKSSGVRVYSRCTPVPWDQQLSTLITWSHWETRVRPGILSSWRLGVHEAHNDMATFRAASPEKMFLSITQTSLQTQSNYVKWGQHRSSLQQGVLAPNLGAGVATVCQPALYIQSTAAAYPDKYFLCKVPNFNKP